MKKYLGMVLLAALTLLAACTSDKKAEAASAPVQSTDTEAPEPKQKPITPLPKEMPQAYTDLSIPLFEGATIRDVAKHNHASSPKLQVRFNTDSTPKEIEDFYIGKMKQLGWTVTNSTKVPKENNVHFSVYNNGEKQFLVNSLTHPETKVTTATMILMDFKKRQ